jgi:hypothetical protein
MSDRPSRPDLFPDAAAPDPARRIRAANVKLRSLRTQLGHDGLTPAGARILIDEITAALEACAQALEGKVRP